MTAAEKKALSQKLYMNGFTQAQTAAILGISDALIEDYWEEWEEAWTKTPDDKIFIRDDKLGFLLDAQHGAGAIGTAFAPRTYRYIDRGDIITEIQIDLTGLDSSGVANDVIGLATGGAAYIGRNVVATHGVIYRVQMTCLEIPLTGDADVILVQGSAADEEFDDTVANTAAVCDGTGDWKLGETIVNEGGLTANYYLYLTQGASDNNTYSAGQFLIRMFGHPALVA